MQNSDLIQFVLRGLGAGIIDVELTANQQADVVTAAFRWYNDRKGLRALVNVPLASGVGQYDLSGLNPEIQTVLKVAFPESTDIDLRAIYGDDLALPGVPWGMFPYGALQGGVYSSLVQAMQYRKNASRIISADPDYEFKFVINPNDPVPANGIRVPKPTLFIYPATSGPSGNAIIEYKGKLSDMTQLPDSSRDEEFVIRRATIAGMTTLSNIRGKYVSLPGARGERTLNGPSLLEEAVRLLTELNEDVASTNMPLPFLSV